MQLATNHEDLLREWCFGTGNIPEDIAVITSEKFCSFRVLSASSSIRFQEKLFPDGFYLLVNIGIPNRRRPWVDLPIDGRLGRDFQVFLAETFDSMQDVLKNMLTGFRHLEFCLIPTCVRYGDISEHHLSKYNYQRMQQIALESLQDDRCIYFREGDWYIELIIFKKNSLEKLYKICQELLELDPGMD